MKSFMMSMATVAVLGWTMMFSTGCGAEETTPPQMPDPTEAPANDTDAAPEAPVDETGAMNSLFDETATMEAMSGSDKKEEKAPELPRAKPFTLTDTHGNKHSLADFRGKYVVLEWVNHGCPFVVKFYRPGKMQEFQAKAAEMGVVWLKICSSAPGKQGYMSAEDWNKKNEELKTKAKATLLDADGKVGRLYGATHTPHMFVINPEGYLIYQGAIDSIRSTRSEDIERATNYVFSALENAKAGRPVDPARTRAYGCTVKY